MCGSAVVALELLNNCMCITSVTVGHYITNGPNVLTCLFSLLTVLLSYNQTCLLNPLLNPCQGLSSTLSNLCHWPPLCCCPSGYRMGIDSQDPLPPPGNLTRTQVKGFMLLEPITLGVRHHALHFLVAAFSFKGLYPTVRFKRFRGYRKSLFSPFFQALGM